MNLFVEGRMISASTHNGLSRYSVGMIEALHAIHPLTVLVSDTSQLHFFKQPIPYLLVPPPSLHGQRLVTKKLNQAGADVLYSPTQFFTSGPRRFKVAMTLHDTIGFVTKGSLRGSYTTQISTFQRVQWKLFHLTKHAQRTILNQANVVLTVSNLSKQHILEAKLTKRPVEVIYNGVAHFSPLDRSDVKKQLLYVGTTFGYKNVPLLVKAINLLPDYKLIIASNVDSYARNQLTSFAKNPDQLVFCNGVSEGKYRSLLSSSQALVTASKHEGFGLPLIEAQASGVPIIVSDIPIFHEVASENSALYFSPDEPEALVEQVRRLETNPTLQRDLITAGIVNSKRFQWDESAKKLLSLLESLE